MFPATLELLKFAFAETKPAAIRGKLQLIQRALAGVWSRITSRWTMIKRIHVNKHSSNIYFEC